MKIFLKQVLKEEEDDKKNNPPTYRWDVNSYMQSDGYHNGADILMGTLGGKVNDEERQFDVINNIGSNRK